MVRDESLYRFLKNVRLPWVIFTLLVFGLLVKLGLWQIARANYKEQRIANIAVYAKNDALPFPQFMKIAKKAEFNSESINDLLISVKAKFDNKHVFLLDNQTNNGQLGYRVLQLVETDKYAILVNLGWVKGSVNRAELPSISAISGEQEIKGHIRVPESGIVLAEQNYQQVQWPFRIQQIELDKLSALLHKQLLPFVVYLDKNEPLGYIKNWQPIVMPPEKHRAYAFQWFSLATAWILLMLWAAIKNNKNKEKGSY